MKTALISISHYNAKSLRALAGVVRSLKEKFPLEKTSSIYEIIPADVDRRAQSIGPVGQGLVVSFSIAFTGLISAFAQILKDISNKENQNLKVGMIHIDLLAIDDEISMLPSMPLPHPDFHKRASFLVPASEIAANYEHPVLEETLSQLLLQVKDKDTLVFYARSNQLLDLS